MTVDDHRLIGHLCGAGLGIDYALTVTVQDAMIFQDHEPDLPLDLLGQVGEHLLWLGAALVTRAAQPPIVEPAEPAWTVEPAWPT